MLVGGFFLYKFITLDTLPERWTKEIGQHDRTRGTEVLRGSSDIEDKS